MELMSECNFFLKNNVNETQQASRCRNTVALLIAGASLDILHCRLCPIRLARSGASLPSTCLASRMGLLGTLRLTRLSPQLAELCESSSPLVLGKGRRGWEEEVCQFCEALKNKCQKRHAIFWLELMPYGRSTLAMRVAGTVYDETKAS